MPTFDNPYSPPTAPDVPLEASQPKINVVYFGQLAACSLAGLAFGVFYIEELVVSLTLQILQLLTVGAGFWIGWGIVVVSSFVTHLILRLNAQTSQSHPRLTAIPVGFCVTLMTKYLLDRQL